MGAKNQKAGQPKSTHEVLTAQGFAPEQALMPRKTVSTAEKGVKYTLEDLADRNTVVYQVDGSIITDGNKCDKLVLVELKAGEEWAEIFVELKGTDVKHALEQIKATVGKQIFQHASNKDIRARIVAKSFPSSKSSPEVEKARKELKSKHNCELKTIKNGQKDRL